MNTKIEGSNEVGKEEEKEMGWDNKPRRRKKRKGKIKERIRY